MTAISELHERLSLLRNYRTLMRQVWKRGKDIFDRIHSPTEVYRIEYARGMESDFVKSKTLSLLQQHFGIDTTLEHCEFIETNSLTSGMRIYALWDMIDISFERVEHILWSL